MHTVSHALCQSIIDYARRAAELGLVPNTQGNVSARDPETNLIAITPHDLPYGALAADDVVIVDLDGRKVAGRHDPSFETPVHCAVYRERPDVFGIVHTEPPYVNCLGAVGIAHPARRREPVGESGRARPGDALYAQRFGGIRACHAAGHGQRRTAWSGPTTG